MSFFPTVILYHHPGQAEFGHPEVLITCDGVRIGQHWFVPEKFDQDKHQPWPVRIWPVGACRGLNGERIEHFAISASYAPDIVRRVRTPSETWWDIPALENV